MFENMLIACFIHCPNLFKEMNLCTKIFFKKYTMPTPNIIMETEIGNIRVHDCIRSIKEIGNYGGILNYL